MFVIPFPFVAASALAAVHDTACRIRDSVARALPGFARLESEMNARVATLEAQVEKLAGIVHAQQAALTTAVQGSRSSPDVVKVVVTSRRIKISAAMPRDSYTSLPVMREYVRKRILAETEIRGSRALQITFVAVDG